MEELINALNTIKDECKKYDSFSCNKCPLGDAVGKCCIKDIDPKHWVVTEPTGVVRIMRR